MKPVTTVLLAGLLVSGCVHRRVTVVDSPRETEVYGEEEVYDDVEGSAYEEECEPVWDGHTFVVVESHIHGGGCGHWYHHGCWHLFPEYHVYPEFGYSWCGDTGGFYYGGDPCARVWDGLAFLFLRGHVHGGGCGHHYHHGCWNTHSDYFHAGSGRHHFTTSPPRTHSVASASKVGGGSGQARRAVTSPGTRAGQNQRNAPARQQPAQAQRAGQPERAGRAPQAGQVQRAGQPAKREQPQRAEQPSKREQPQRVEQPPRRQDAPKREQPQRIEQPPRRQDPPKREQPQRIEQPPRRQEGPKREAPPQKQEAPKKREPEKKEPERRR